MGFGIVFFGYCCLLLQELGGMTVGAFLLAYGFFLAARTNAKFMYAAVTSLFMLPRGITILLDVVGVIKLDDLPGLNLVTFILHTAAWILMSVFWMSAVYEIAVKNNAAMLEGQAKRQLIITICFILLAFAVQAMHFAEVSVPYVGEVLVIRYVLQYIIIIYNLIFVHTCFLRITSESKYRKELQELASERADEMQKRYRQQQEEEAEKNEKARRRR